jgi:hypothetical protein
MRSILALGLVAGMHYGLAAGDEKGTLQTATTEPPMELAEGIRKVLPTSSIQVTGADGQSIGEFWFRTTIPVDATPTQIKNGLTYREIRQTEILGAVRFDRDWTDYRKQKVKAGVYTLRLGFQPTIDDHVGASEHQEFLLVTAAEKDEGPDIIEPKDLIERSLKSLGTKHPGVFMLFPNPRPALKAELTTRPPRNHVLLNVRTEPVALGKKTGSALGLSLTIVGHAE